MNDTVADNITLREPTSSRVKAWQLLLVPGIIAPLYTAVPLWIDTIWAKVKDYKSGSAIEAQQQMTLAANNIPCLSAPFNYYESINKLKIDGTICKTGDVLVRALDEQQRPAIYFLPSSVIRERIALSQSGTLKAPKLEQPVSAQALPPVRFETARLWRAGFVPGDNTALSAGFMRVQYQFRVLCSQQLDQRYLRQRIQRADGCFDQIIDLANGAVVRVTPAPCQC